MERGRTIEGDEARDLARDPARRLRVAPAKAVEAALRSRRGAPEPAPPEEAPQERAAFRARVPTLAARARAELGERATSSHDDLRGPDGLPP